MFCFFFFVRYSIPSTTSMETVKSKISMARGKIFVDVGFWGGLVDGNSKDIEKMVQSGVIGIHCSLCNLENFNSTTKEEIEKVIPLLDESILAVSMKDVHCNNLKHFG